MAQDEQMDALYDFLYRDSSRITSYYAQIFGGHLSGTEDITIDRHMLDKTGRVNAALAGGDVKFVDEQQSSLKRIVSPHDVVTTDILSSLQQNGFVHQDVVSAPHGSLVLVRGTLTLVDKHMMELAAVTFDMTVQAELRKPRPQQDQAKIQSLKSVQAFISKLPLPSSFLLESVGGVQVAGTLKDEGMEEPISSYYFRHGTAGLAEVYLMGIKEVASGSFTLPDTQLIGAGLLAAQAMHGMLFPPGCTIITPVAFFRKMQHSGLQVS